MAVVPPVVAAPPVVGAPPVVADPPAAVVPPEPGVPPWATPPEPPCGPPVSFPEQAITPTRVNNGSSKKRRVVFMILLSCKGGVPPHPWVRVSCFSGRSKDVARSPQVLSSEEQTQAARAHRTLALRRFIAKRSKRLRRRAVYLPATPVDNCRRLFLILHTKPLFAAFGSAIPSNGSRFARSRLPFARIFLHDEIPISLRAGCIP